MPVGGCTDNDVTLLQAGVPAGPNKATGTLWPSPNPTSTSYVWSGSDLSGFSTPDFNATNFGVQISAIGTSGSLVANVDYIQITITYTPAGGGSTTQQKRPLDETQGTSYFITTPS